MTPAESRTLSILLVQAKMGAIEEFQDSLAAESRRPISIQWAGTLDHTMGLLGQGGVDVVLLDPDLPDGKGLVAFQRVHAFAPDVPIIILAEGEDDEIGLAAMQEGAQDFLPRVSLMPEVVVRTIRHAVERNRLLAALRSLSLLDDLTGLYNRRGFSKLGEQHLKLAQRTSRGALLVFCDLDRFKAINDTLGHHVGDRALLKMTQLLRGCFRGSDVIARLGGDEFAVLALEVSGEDEAGLVHRLRARIRESSEKGEEPYELSVSIGTARFEPSKPAPLEDLLARADAAMYGEKRTKRTGMLP